MNSLIESGQRIQSSESSLLIRLLRLSPVDVRDGFFAFEKLHD